MMDAASRGARFLSLLPPPMAAEIWALSGGKNRFWERLQELRLRVMGRSSLVFGNRQRLLSSRLELSEMEELLLRLCGGSLYAYEECIAEGYLPYEGGIRIGVCGRARYERGEMRGVCDIASLAIRFPHAPPAVAEDAVLRAFMRARQGLLIYSAPGVGKTTALRALALSLGRGDAPMRVVVIDERMEFPPEEYRDATVDVLRGYHRADALQIAHRSMNPEVVILDEIGGREEAEALASLLRGGTLAVASAHAASYADLCRRGALRPFLAMEAFDAFLGIKRENGHIVYEETPDQMKEGRDAECCALLV